MELHPPIGMLSMTETHERAILAPGRLLNLIREAAAPHLQAVVSGRHERIGDPSKEPLAVMANLGRLAMHQLRSAFDLATESLAQNLIAPGRHLESEGAGVPR